MLPAQVIHDHLRRFYAAFIGVRISCDMFDRNVVFALFATSAARRAFSISEFAWRSCSFLASSMELSSSMRRVLFRSARSASLCWLLSTRYTNPTHSTSITPANVMIIEPVVSTRLTVFTATASSLPYPGDGARNSIPRRPGLRWNTRYHLSSAPAGSVRSCCRGGTPSAAARNKHCDR